MASWPAPASEVIFVILVTLMILNSNEASEDEAKLLKNLLDKYHIYERPVYDENKPVNLVFGISLRQIIDLDERNQLLKSNLWLEYTWQDVNLMWNYVSFLIFRGFYMKNLIPFGFFRRNMEISWT